MCIRITGKKAAALLYLVPWVFFKVTGYYDVDSLIIELYATSIMTAIALIVEYLLVAWSVWTLLPSEIRTFIKKKK